MKRISVLVSMILILCSLVFAITEKPYTVMLYMIGSDLESYDGFAETDLYEILDADTENINVIIQTGGCYEWFMEGIENNNQRWEVQDDNLKLVKNLGKLNMGESQTLQDFIEWTVDRYPAEKYVILFWNHGSGAIGGFGDDELFDGDGLLLNELKIPVSRACKKKNMKFEMVGFDACLMGTLETAYMFREDSRYFIASQELEPGEGWWYTGFLDLMNTGADIVQIGKRLIDDFAEVSADNDEGEEITLSMIDLKKISPIYTSLEKMISPMFSKIENERDFYEMNMARNKAQSFGYSGGFGGYTDMVDIFDLAYQFRGHYPGPSRDVMTAITDAVVYNHAGPIRKNSHGLSIYFPSMDRENFEYNNEIYTSLPLPVKYSEFVEVYSEKLLDLSIDDLWDKPVEDYYDYIAIDLSDDELSRLAEIYLCVGTYLDNDGEEWLFLGQELIDMDEDTQAITAPIVETWPAINDVFIYLNVVSYDEDHVMYAIPGELNGTTVNLMLLYNDANPFGRILGARKVETEDLFYTSKKLIKIKEGDVFEPYYEYEDEEVTEYISFGEKIRFGKTVKVEESELPDGFYVYGFKFIDYVGNIAYSEFVEIEFY